MNPLPDPKTDARARPAPRRHPYALLLALLFMLMPGPAQAEDTPWKKQAFLGLSCRDTPSGLVVGWIAPGPLRGRGRTSASGIRRGDNVVSVDGKPVDQASLEALLKQKQPGETIVLVTRRSGEANQDGAVPKGGAGGTQTTHTVVLGSRAEWGGTIKRGLDGRVIKPLGAGAHETLILEAATQLSVRTGEHGGGLDALLAHLWQRQSDALDTNSLPAVVNTFRRPLSLDAVEADIATYAERARSGDLDSIRSLIRHVLDLKDTAPMIEELMSAPVAELTPSARRSMIRFAGQHLEQYSAREERRHVERLLQTMRTNFYIYDEHANEHVKTLNDRMGPRVELMLALSLAMLRLAPSMWEALASSHAKDAPLKDVPEDVRSVVPTGDVLWFGKDMLGHITVVGGPGPNTYNMSKAGAVYDVGGDDHYTYARRGDVQMVSLRLIIDLAGNDTHESTADFEGPATGVYGLSLLDDRAGNDIYRSNHAFSIGAGLVGIGILIDHQGNDTYENRGPAAGWAMGAGFWGAGLVIDRAGHDVYRGEKLAQGVGGPRGFGTILEGGGRDLYVANGPAFPSAYGTPGAYLGMSQGFGIGVRGYAAGGVGALFDYAGNDRYEAGEFSQAGGYYWGLGILHDFKGNDLYHGNRYGQAFAAHQAAGILIDDAGDDTYWSMTAASQGGAWDESVAMLIDRGGNDSYRCDGLGQGAASMQAIGLLIDLGGDDRYSASTGATQGQGGGNAYHYDATKIFSFSGLFDLGGGRDSYKAGRTNNSESATGTFIEKTPASSSLHGVFVDR